MCQRLLLLFFCLLNTFVLFAQQTRFILKAGDFDREATPVSFQSAKSLPTGEYLLIDQRTKKRFNAQVLAGSHVNFILPEKLAAGAEAAFLLKKNPVRVKSQLVVLESSAGISIRVSGKPVLFYHTAAAKPPADSPAYYQRSGFIHPLQSPSGRILTDDFPAGHAHQHGIMMAWASTSFRNNTIDFWNQQNKTGNVRHSKLLSVEKGSVLVKIKLQLEHYSFQHGIVLNEIWTIICYPFSSYFLFDIISEQENVGSDSLLLKKYHYGGMEFRGSREWNEDDKKHFTNKWTVQTDSAFQSTHNDEQHLAFVDVSGKVNGKYCGTAVFSFPSNFRYPQPIRLHPTMPYWCFAPTVYQGFAIAPAGKLSLRYRYFVYDGKPDRQKINSVNADIYVPPAVKEIL